MIAPGLSLVIPAYNEENFLPATLASVNEARAHFATATGAGSEVIVVDNASTDRTAEVARAGGATVIRHAVRNIASVRNAGISASKFAVVVTIDADCTLPADGLIQIWNYMYDEKHIGAALGVRLISPKLANRAVASVVQTATRLTSGIYGGMFVFRREAALAIGGFPEERLIAEDAGFAVAMRRYAKSRGEIFGSLREVKIGTLDRKDFGARALPRLVVQVLKAFLGRKQSASDLPFWYKPDR